MSRASTIGGWASCQEQRMRSGCGALPLAPRRPYACLHRLADLHGPPAGCTTLSSGPLDATVPATAPMSSARRTHITSLCRLPLASATVSASGTQWPCKATRLCLHQVAPAPPPPLSWLCSCTRGQCPYMQSPRLCGGWFSPPPAPATTCHQPGGPSKFSSAVPALHMLTHRSPCHHSWAWPSPGPSLLLHVPPLPQGSLLTSAC